jgi:hypothetical protein
MSEEYAGEWVCDFKGNVIYVKLFLWKTMNNH